MATATANNAQQQALVKKKDALTTIFDLLDKSKQQIAMALPKHLTPERMIRVARTAISKTPKLQECTPLSIIGSVIEASELGLEVNTPLGLAYLIPRFNKKTQHAECNFQPGYRGLIQLAYRSGQVSWITAELVFDCDKFAVKFGTARELIHEPDLDNPERGTKDKDGHLIGLRGAYAVIRMKDGTTDFEYLSKVQLNQLRARSEAEQKGWFSAWTTDEDEMYRKAPIRRGAKRWPLSPEFQRVAIKDEYVDAGVDVGEADAEVISSEVSRLATEQREAALLDKYKPEDENQGNPQPPEEQAQPTPATTQEAPSESPVEARRPRSRNSGKAEPSGVPLQWDK